LAAQIAEVPDSGPYLALVGHSGVVRAKLGLRSWESPFLDLTDAKGVVRASLGSISLEDPNSGDQVRRPTSSLILFDSAGTALWKTPWKQEHAAKK
jgi:hypothetical protein